MNIKTEFAMLKESFYFLRHGQTNGNKNSLLQGITDAPLNEEGINQAKLIASKLKKENISHIVSSPLKRALKTAEIVSNEIQKPITIIKELHEISFGDLEDTENPYPEEFLKKWIKNEVHEKYKMEGLKDLKNRISKGLDKAFQIEQKPILVVSHGIVYYALCELLNIEFSRLDNCQHIFHEF